MEVSILRLAHSYSVATEHDGPDLYETIEEALEAIRAILLEPEHD